jgi:hypothetical protein
MKTFLVIVLLAAIYLVFFRHHTTSLPEDHPAVAEVTAKPDGSNYFKRPLDRTHEVINQVQKQRQEDKY